PHYLGKSALEGFAKVQTGSAYWYATVALYNTSEKSARNAGKRRMIFEILKFYTPEGSYDDTAGSITALIYSPSHYGEAKSGSKPSFQLVVGHPFDLASLGSLHIPPGTSWADVA
ncbi:MAG TPA: hypothetical protein VFS44_07630, partial [Gemmatimonadaceae bacterium]|nr:hypothetical protein [Gemmatimonadaceae bacterium]